MPQIRNVPFSECLNPDEEWTWMIKMQLRDLVLFVNVKNTHWGVLLLVKLQNEACN